jgi:pimeloyl-ACP methyl ester carboxylesterase
MNKRLNIACYATYHATLRNTHTSKSTWIVNRGRLKMTDKLHQTIQLADGRQLGYAELGQTDGFPVLYFHGGNGSRLESQWFKSAVEHHGIRLIAPDRPGFGLSDFQPNRTFLDWADDVKQLTDSLGIEMYSVFGLSGGAPHVLAVCTRLAEQINRAVIVSGVAPPNAPNRFKGMWFPIRLLFFFSRYVPFIKTLFLKQMGKFYSDRDMMEKRMLQALPQPDKDLIQKRPDILDIYVEDATESHRNGIQGDSWEWNLYVNDWGLNISQIQTSIGLWYGKVDQNAPLTMGEYYAKALPNSTLHVVDNGGHFSTINNHIDDISQFLK